MIVAPHLAPAATQHTPTPSPRLPVQQGKPGAFAALLEQTDADASEDFATPFEDCSFEVDAAELPAPPQTDGPSAQADDPVQTDAQPQPELHAPPVHGESQILATQSSPATAAELGAQGEVRTSGFAVLTSFVRSVRTPDVMTATTPSADQAPVPISQRAPLPDDAHATSSARPASRPPLRAQAQALLNLILQSTPRGLVVSARIGAASAEERAQIRRGVRALLQGRGAEAADILLNGESEGDPTCR